MHGTTTSCGIQLLLCCRVMPKLLLYFNNKSRMDFFFRDFLFFFGFMKLGNSGGFEKSGKPQRLCLFFGISESPYPAPHTFRCHASAASENFTPTAATYQEVSESLGPAPPGLVSTPPSRWCSNHRRHALGGLHRCRAFRFRLLYSSPQVPVKTCQGQHHRSTALSR